MADLHPELAAKVARVLAAMAALGFPMKIVQGVRTAEQQHELWRQGRETPGSIVTRCDGYVVKSNHQPNADGYGHAVDCAFTTGEMFGEQQPWKAYGELGKAVGLVWGGDWTKFTDRPHLELS